MGVGWRGGCGALLRRCQPLSAHILGLCQRRGLVGLCVFPSVMVWGPLLLSSNLHDGFLRFIFPVDRVQLVRSGATGVIPKESS